jgi:hypothetical protein
LQQIRKQDDLMNKTPKLLPWVARKAGVSIEKAAALWQEAAAHVSLQTEPGKDPDHYYHLMVGRLRALAERGKPAHRPAASPLLVLARHGSETAAVLLNPCTFVHLPS